MVGCEALIARWKCVPRVQGEQLVKQSGACSPVAKDEDRRRIDGGLPNLATEKNLLYYPQNAVKNTDNGHDGADPPIAPTDAEAIPGQQQNPGPEAATLPDVGTPSAAARGAS